jgi:acetylglutamate synthase
MLLRIEALQDGTLQRRITMLHRATFHTLEPLSPIPKLWQDYLATHQTAGNDKETVVDNNDAKRVAVLEEENRLCEATLVLLNTHGVVATVTNDTSKKIVAFGGALTIRGPKFNAAGCTSANPLILRRIRTLLENGCK